LFERATQAVPGQGQRGAELAIVGEQPGDQEDQAGVPFVGPAGRLLDRALADAGIDRERVYLTNAVKHFKWRAKGPKRIHDKPSWAETVACRPWLDRELELVEPRVLLLLGATAARSLLGRDFRVTQHRGAPVDTDIAEIVFATIHPSAVLRTRDDRDAVYADFVRDLQTVAEAL
jgi:DNA polymerase